MHNTLHPAHLCEVRLKLVVSRKHHKLAFQAVGVGALVVLLHEVFCSDAAEGGNTHVSAGLTGFGAFGVCIQQVHVVRGSRARRQVVGGDMRPQRHPLQRRSAHTSGIAPP
jgi:hypothetical protein